MSYSRSYDHRIKGAKDLGKRATLRQVSLVLYDLWVSHPPLGPISDAYEQQRIYTRRIAARGMAGGITAWAIIFAAVFWAFQSMLPPEFAAVRYTLVAVAVVTAGFALLANRPWYEERHLGDKVIAFIRDYNNLTYILRGETFEKFCELPVETLKLQAFKWLVERAKVVLEIERDNAGVDEEHWRDKKREKVKGFEEDFRLICRFKLADATKKLTAYYDKARAELATSTYVTNDAAS